MALFDKMNAFQRSEHERVEQFFEKLSPEEQARLNQIRVRSGLPPVKKPVPAISKSCAEGKHYADQQRRCTSCRGEMCTAHISFTTNDDPGQILTGFGCTLIVGHLGPHCNAHYPKHPWSSWAPLDATVQNGQIISKNPCLNAPAVELMPDTICAGCGKAYRCLQIHAEVCPSLKKAKARYDETHRPCCIHGVSMEDQKVCVGCVEMTEASKRMDALTNADTPMPLGGYAIGGLVNGPSKDSIDLAVAGAQRWLRKAAHEVGSGSRPELEEVLVRVAPGIRAEKLRARVINIFKVAAAVVAGTSAAFGAFYGGQAIVNLILGS